jgi:hypothetical protein
MGRELKRVPLHFDWPMGMTWIGYINPFEDLRQNCGVCDGSGYSPDAIRFQNEWYGDEPFDAVTYGSSPLKRSHQAIVAQARRNSTYIRMELESEIDRLFNLWSSQWCHQLSQVDVDALVAAGRLKSLGPDPTADDVNTWSFSGMGHDAINAYICIKARCERDGVTHLCDTCLGSGDFWPDTSIEILSERCSELIYTSTGLETGSISGDELKRFYEEWESTDPPTGPGYQLWETTSIGSPQSPVFKTLEELCLYAEENCTTFGSHRASADEWFQMLSAGLVAHQSGNLTFI